MNRAAVVQVLCRVSRRRPSDIADHLSLATLGLSSSLGLSLLRSGLEAESGRTLGIIDGRMKVADLIGVLTNGAPAASISGGASVVPSDSSTLISSAGSYPGPNASSDPVRNAAEQPVASNGAARLPENVGLGLDIQDLDSMPQTSDFRAHTFYRDHFSQSEIATALLRPDPRAHLCGIFCAKEAAKKSHPLLLNERMSSFLVSHDAAGKPSLELLDGRAAVATGFRFVLSISHTSSFAAAACMTFWT